MEKNKLAQGVKDLRKRKGLSQEDLSLKSGLSLRTIQRVENGESEPTGETLKRISAVFGITPNELIDWNFDKENLKYTVKTKNEYLHIFDSKLVISTSPEINDLVIDYQKSVNNVFKTLMVFFIFIPIFSTLAIIFYNMGKIGLAINTGAYAVFFLTIAFYIMLFTSGSSLINMESINKIKIQRKLFNNVVVIFHRESGRLKKRHLILDENQVDNLKNILLSENLIKEKDVELKNNKISILAYILTFIIIVPSYSLILKNTNKNVDIIMTYYGTVVVIISSMLLITMIRNIIKPLFYKKQQTANTRYSQ
jgi:transcriptional regulator with XRE-family HTH domain